MKHEIIILGAGPAGITCSYGLAKKGRKSLLVEKNKQIGGSAKTVEFDEDGLKFRTDMGPHRFFSKNQSLYRMMEGLLGKDWMLVKRQTRQLIGDKYYDYPINAMQAFRNIGMFRSISMGSSYLYYTLLFRLSRKKINNFEDYVFANFGRKLGEFNILNYTEKIWGIPCKDIHPDWAKQRIKGLSLTSVIKNIFFKSKDGPKTLVDAFYYPRYGTGTIYESMARVITKEGSKIETNSYPIKISHSDNKVKSVTLDVNGEINTFTPEKLVSSIPLTDMINLLDPLPPEDVINAAKRLRWRSQVYLFITLNKEKVTDDNWIYFPNEEVPFGRIAEMKNFSKEMCPAGKTSLFVEFFVDQGDKIWNMDKDELFSITINHLEKYGLIKKRDVRSYYLIKQSNVYPIYDISYKESLDIIKKYLANFENLISIGRPGRFCYTNQDHSLEMGIIAARSIMESKAYGLDDIGNEKEYFEKWLLN